MPSTRLRAEEGGGVLPVGLLRLVLTLPEHAPLSLRVVRRNRLVDASMEEAGLELGGGHLGCFLRSHILELKGNLRLPSLLAMGLAVVTVLLVAAVATLLVPSAVDPGHAAALWSRCLARSLRSASASLGSTPLLLRRLGMSERPHVLLMLLHELQDVRLLFSGQRGVQGLIETLLRLQHLLGVSLRCEGVEDGELSVRERGGHRCRLVCCSLELCSG